MKKVLSLLVLALVAVPAALRAQAESIYLSGTVRNLHTGAPEPFCIVQLRQDSVGRFLRMADAEGFFAVDSLPAGRYTLQVSASYMPLYQAELVLAEDANLDIRVDTIRRVGLRSVRIRSERQALTPGKPHQLGGRLITSADDKRLWNFGGQMKVSGPASEDLSDPFGLAPRYKRRPLAKTRPYWEVYERHAKLRRATPSDSTARSWLRTEPQTGDEGSMQ